MAKKWTKKEDELLEKLVNDGMKNSDLYQFFPNRGIPSINSRASRIRSGKPLEYITGELEGKKVGKLTVGKKVGVEIDEKNNVKYNLYECICQCDENHTNKIIVREGNLRTYNTTSCGCNKKMELDKNPNRKYNEYHILNNVVFVKFSNCNEYFLCDLDDWESFGKNHSWYKDAQGYAVSRVKGELKYMHMMIMGTPEGMDTDHEFRVSNGLCDNRKSNLVVKTHRENSINVGLRSNNTSGYTGVKQNKNGDWIADIIVAKKLYRLGTYKNKIDAIIARLQAEYDLLRELAPQRHLFKEFGIDDSDLNYNDNAFVNPDQKILTTT